MMQPTFHPQDSMLCCRSQCKMVNTILRREKMSSSNWFLKPQSNPNADLKLFCFPYAGGSAATYMSWAKSLPANAELIPVQLPGRANRLFEPAYSNMDSLISELLNEIEPMLNQPYILFGHSLGSRVAFELMAQCKKSGLPIPEHFIASGSRGPQNCSFEKPIHHLSNEDFILKLMELNGTPKEVLENEELMTLCLPLLRADFELAHTYSYTSNEKFNCAVSILGGEEDHDITRCDLLSWGDFFSQSQKLHFLPGDHFFIESDKQQVLKIVNSIINETLKNLSVKTEVEIAAI